ncbi:MAG: cytochrome b, partial [Candidatus Microthrix parvicella]
WLSFFYEPSFQSVVYNGSFEKLQGVEMSAAYRSAISLSFDVRAGLVMRQIHHWAALIFVAAIVVHMARIFFTGAFRKPREINWVVGVTMLLLGMVNGFAGYSLLDDQLSAVGLRIANSMILSIPVGGTWLSSLAFGGPYPGPDTLQRLFVAHVLLVPALLTGLIGVHLALLIRSKHTHFPGKREREDNVVGQRLWPTYAAKAIGLFFLTAALLALLGGVAQINAISNYGPFRVANVSSASQPDWYMGWPDGALRLFPNWEIRLGGYTVANVFFPGVLLIGAVFTLIYLWPWIEARKFGDDETHNVLERPRDNPLRTGIGVGGLTFLGVLLVAGSSDVISITFGLSVNAVIWTLRVLLFVLPPITGRIAVQLCRELQARDRAEAPVESDSAR